MKHNLVRTIFFFATLLPLPIVAFAFAFQTGGTIAGAEFGFGGVASAYSVTRTGGKARAQTIPSTPYGLLEGASTFVDKKWNPSPGPNVDLTSAVTAVKFHTNVPDNTGTQGAVYIPSYQPGGLVDEPVGIAKEMNGVHYTEYSGELSGYGYSSFGGEQYVYGRIGAPNESTDHPTWATARQGLKGVPFILRIPKDWNGNLVHFMHGDLNSLTALFITTPFDEFYLLSQGFAYITMDCTGYSQATDTNQNNDEYWRDALYGDWQFYPLNPSYVTPNVSLLLTDGTSKPWKLIGEPMFSRDAIRVMKNICSRVTGKPVDRTYLWARSLAGDLSIGLTTGRSWNGVYLGGDYVTPFSNCPIYPDGTRNPEYSLNTPMVYDGFLNFQTVDDPLWKPDYSYVMDLDPAMPMSSAPFVQYDGASFSWDRLLLPWLAYKAKNDRSRGDFSAYWPDVKKTDFYYMFENMPHFGRENAYAVDKNGNGLYAKIDAESGDLSFNTDGDGQEVRWEIKKLWNIDPSVLINSITNFHSMPGLFLYFGNTSPRSYGLSHQLLNNLHSYVTKGNEMPKSILDPYWINGGTMWPKFNNYAGYGRSDITDASPQADIRKIGGGAYYVAMSGVLTHDVLNYDRAQAAPIRMPDDAARLGLYRNAFAGLFEFIYYPFGQDDLINGFPAIDWNGLPLVTMILPNGKTIPQVGYKDHGGYVSAASQAVNNLAKMGLWDKQLVQNFITDASQSEYPIIESKNLGEALKKLVWSPAP